MRVISGIQPTGATHIGNYLGALKNWIEIQDKHECLFFVADLHAITSPYDPQGFANQTHEKTVELLALGLNPEQCTLFIQSQIKEHVELAWIFQTIIPVGELSGMTQYKEKSKKFRHNINAGLFAYPVLQAADILLYRADLVPVGKDQQQHLELTRTIARKFNQRFGQKFSEPKAMILGSGAKIMSLADPKKKMSKSDKPESYIGVFDDPKTIEKKIMAAVTDAGKEIIYNPGKKPGISNLLNIYSLFSGAPIKEAEKSFRKKGYAALKKQIAQLLAAKLEPFRKKKQELASRDVYVKEMMARGTKNARQLASFTMEEVRKKVGLG